GQGNGPVDAAVAALSELGAGWRVLSFEERSTTASATSGSAPACAVVELANDGKDAAYGVGIDNDIVAASIQALVAAINRMGRPTAAGVQSATQWAA
ncbi:MAG TPA: alpha-isopropylmalate synthase regulatory domain-containing protein, partial [Aquabacterium sp.]|uniref:alpha-isopropylmalate synthase regulatory domain-containing protein n=1 Tax=Aquabacterium sp. TaxID=1872578 RepID=UPI002E32C0D8